MRIVCVGVCARAMQSVWMYMYMYMYMWGPGHNMVQNLSLVDNTGKITKGLFFIGTKQEQFGHILQRD